MVIRGPFEVSLVPADSDFVFKEHVHTSGEIYVEVEPDMDYFIRVESTFESMVRADFCVDGTDLGYYINLSPGEEELRGVWETEGNKNIYSALCFCIQESPLNCREEKPWFGSVEVKFSELIEEKFPATVSLSKCKTSNVKYRWASKSIKGKISEDTKKVVKSVKGTTKRIVEYKEGTLSQASNNSPSERRYRTGKKLATIKIYYCTAVGLIRAGILPKPPLWDLHRLEHPPALSSPKKMTRSKIRCLNVTPKSITVMLECPDLGLEEKVVDFFDLVDADNSDDEEERKHVNRKLEFHPETPPIMNETSQSDEPCSEPSGNAPLVNSTAEDEELSTVNATAYSAHPEEAMPRKRLRSGRIRNEEISCDI